MSSFKRFLSALGCMAGLASFTAFGGATEYLFNKTSGGIPPSATPYQWSDAANWGDGTGSAPAGTKEDFPVFNGLTSAMVVQMPDEVKLGAMSRRGSGTVHLLGKTLTVLAGGWTGKQGTYNPLAATRIDDGNQGNGIIIYADVKPEQGFSGTWSVAGDMTVKSGYEITSSIGTQRWRGDLYANSSSETRTDAFVLNQVNNSSSAMQFIGPNGSAARDSAGWSLTDGSVFAKYTGSSIGTIAPGCTVTCDGLADGTFVRRYLEGLKIIELSQAATGTVASATLRFGAYDPVTTGRVSSLIAAGNGAQSLTAYQNTKLGTFTITVDDLSSSVYHETTFNGQTYPAHLVVKRTDKFLGGAYFAYATDMTYTEPTAGLAGLAYAKGVRFGDSATHRATVEAGVDAVYTNITKLSSASQNQADTTVIKQGEGSLLLDFSADITAAKSKFVAAGGTLTLAPRAASVPFSNVVVTNGATLAVRGTGTAVSDVKAYDASCIDAAAGTTVDLTSIKALPSGFRLTGAGTFILVSFDTLKGVTVGSEATVRLAQEGDARGFKPTGAVVPKVVGEPAFWVDAAKEVTLFSTNGTSIATGTAFSYTDCIACWRDCRYSQDPAKYGKLYATNDFTGVSQTGSGTAPSRLVQQSSFPCVRHMGDLAFGTTPGMDNYRSVHAGMTWNAALTNIYAVFTVLYQVDNCAQCILGATHRFLPSSDRGDFSRMFASGDPAGIASAYKAWIFSCLAADQVKNGWIYFNGVERAWNSVNYRPYSIEIIESHPLDPGGRADAFAIQDYGSNSSAVTCSGCQYQFETIVYTNKLTMAERAQVCSYLMEKYRGQPYTIAGGTRYAGKAASDEIATSDGEALNLTVDTLAYAGRVSGAGTVVKKGAGKLYADLVEDASLDVEGGTLVVHSAKKPTGCADLPANHFLHLDASVTNRMELRSFTETINDGYDEKGAAKSGYSYSYAVTNEVRHWYDAQFGNDGRHVYGTYRHSDPSYRCGWLVTNALNGLPAVDYRNLFTYKTPMSHSRRFFHEFHTAEDNNPIRANPMKSMFLVKNAAAGGNWLLGDTNSGYGIMRTDGASYSAPILHSETLGISVTLNGAEIDPWTTGYSGGWDLLAVHANMPYSGNNIGGNAGFIQTGGQKIGEVLIYTNALTWTEARTVEAYLGGKWFNTTVSYAAPSSAGAVTVAAGATLEIEGDQPLAVTSLRGAGTVKGAVAFSSDAVLEVVVNADGSVVPPGASVTGTVDLSAGGTVRVTGHPEKLRSGTYRLLAATSVTGAGAWTVEAGGSPRSCRLAAGATALDLVVTSPGTLVILR